ncbi:MAG: prephenate dehydratase, partial [Bacteroidetes bacterium]|nr:prephenate dehydratase [Bacteroidota bacterium]
AQSGVSLSHIQSRPSKRKAWDYLFFMEMEGHAYDPNVKSALEQLEQQSSTVKVLGSWPRE